MPSIRLDKNVALSTRELCASKRLGNGTSSGLIWEALKFFNGKHSECFVCPYHVKHVAGMELGRQKKALDDMSKNAVQAPQVEWISIGMTALALAKRLARAQGKTAKVVVEQAVLEHLTRPPTCDKCPFYQQMCDSVKVRNRRV